MDQDELLNQLLALPEEVLERNYIKAISLYNEGKLLDTARKMFKNLVIARPMKKKYWFGLAATQTQLKEYDQAIKSWAIAALLDDNDPYAHFHAAECLYIISDKEQTNKALLEAQKRCNKDHPLLEKIVKMKKMLSNTKKIKTKC